MTSPKKISGDIGDAVSRSQSLKSILIEEGALAQVPALIDHYFNGRHAFLVGDANTFAAAGNRLVKILSDHSFTSDCFVFPAKPYLKSSVENANSFTRKLSKSKGVPVAVGSGVINDLVKYAAFQLDLPYLCVATAASMDGYASAGSPLSQKGFKHTIGCAPPPVIVADLKIIADAPPEMAGWGYGDLCGKIPAGADWIIADTLGIETIDEIAWPLVQNNLKSWIDDPAGVAAGETGAIKHLLTGLLLSSIAMELHASSRPASGADHQIAHMWEMDNLKKNGLPVSHGTCVAIGALSVLTLYHWLLRQDFTKLDGKRIIRRRRQLYDLKKEIDERFTSSAVAERAFVEVEAKFVEDRILFDRINLIKKKWPELKNRLTDFLYPYKNIEKDLRTAGVETDPAAMGISREYHRQTVIAARLIRRRYTILDLLEETGCFDMAVGELFPLH